MYAKSYTILRQIQKWVFLHSSKFFLRFSLNLFLLHFVTIYRLMHNYFKSDFLVLSFTYKEYKATYRPTNNLNTVINLVISNRWNPTQKVRTLASVHLPTVCVKFGVMISKIRQVESWHKNTKVFVWSQFSAWHTPVSGLILSTCFSLNMWFKVQHCNLVVCSMFSYFWERLLTSMQPQKNRRESVALSGAAVKLSLASSANDC